MKTLFYLFSLVLICPFTFGQTTICQGGTRNYSVDDADGNSGTPGSTYNWSVLQAGFQGNINSVGTPTDTNDVDVDWGTTPVGIYTLQVIEVNGDNCDGTPMQHTVEVLPLPDAPNISTNTASICSGDDGSFTFTGEANSMVYFTINGGAVQSVQLDGNGQYVLNLPDLNVNTQVEVTAIDNGVCTRNNISGTISLINVLQGPTTSAIVAN